MAKYFIVQYGWEMYSVGNFNWNEGGLCAMMMARPMQTANIADNILH